MKATRTSFCFGLAADSSSTVCPENEHDADTFLPSQATSGLTERKRKTRLHILRENAGESTRRSDLDKREPLRSRSPAAGRAPSLRSTKPTRSRHFGCEPEDLLRLSLQRIRAACSISVTAASPNGASVLVDSGPLTITNPSSTYWSRRTVGAPRDPRGRRHLDIHVTLKKGPRAGPNAHTASTSRRQGPETKGTFAARE